MVEEKIIQYVIHAKLDPTKKYLCLIDPFWVYPDSYEHLYDDSVSKGNLLIIKVKSIDRALKFVELPENVIGIATEKEVMPNESGTNQ